MSKILLIDDDADFRTVLKHEFADLGYEVLMAPDGVRGLQLVLDSSIDVIFLDLNMPHRNGIETLRLIRSVQSTVPVFIVTALIDDATRAEAGRLGIADIIFKPASIKDLIAAARSVPGAPRS